jgi:excisionase family DNA binding protein
MEKLFLNVDELSQYTGIARGTLYVWVCQKRIPHLKIGRMLKFDVREIEVWLAKRRVKALDFYERDANV